MAKKNENEIKTKDEQAQEQPVLAKELEYQCIGNIEYIVPKTLPLSTVFELKAQVPFRITQNELKTVSTGLKVRIPENYIGLIVNGPVLDLKTQVCVFGSPVIIRPELDFREIIVSLKMLGTGYKIFNMGDTLAQLVIIPAKDIKTVKK